MDISSNPVNVDGFEISKLVALDHVEDHLEAVQSTKAGYKYNCTV